MGAEIVNNVLNGVSASCFAYGHTGEGEKSFRAELVLDDHYVAEDRMCNHSV